MDIGPIRTVTVPTEFKTVPGTEIVIRKNEILGANTIAYTAWEPVTTHKIISHIIQGAGPYGLIGTESIPDDIAALPAFSDERLTAVRQWQYDRDNRAFDLIRQVFPEAEAATTGVHDLFLPM